MPEPLKSMQKLNRQTTQLLANRPNKVLQFGGGNFLRAFTDWMIDELNKTADFNAGVIIVKPTEKSDYTALRAQDGLFHLLTNGLRNGELVAETQLIQCIQQIIHPYREWDHYLKSAESPTIRFIISNTTESGIQFSPSDQFSDSPPSEFPAKLTKWLYHRWQYFQGKAERGCIILPCELIEQNGQILQSLVLKYAELWNLEKTFNNWIKEHNYFCNTLVDRIVPGFPKEQLAEVYQKIGFKDDLLVSAEPYHIWVIEASKAVQAELPFEQTHLNVVFTEDLKPYRQLKVRILNGAHTTMVPVGYLAGIDTVREAVEHEVMGPFIKKALFEEILPTLDFDQSQKEKYAFDVLDRFKNPFIHHQLISIALNSSSKYKTRVLPSLLDYVELKGSLPKNLVTALAALIYFYSGKRGTQTIPLKDSETVLSFFKQIWQDWEQTKDTAQLVQAVLANENLWAQDLNKVDDLRTALIAEIDQRFPK